MEDKDLLIAQLKSELKTRDSEIILAATYGNQLVAEKASLSSKIDELLVQNEKLVQENHSLQLDLERQVQALASQTQELESQRDQIDNFSERLQGVQKENDALQKKSQSLSKENTYLKKSHDDLTIENSSLKEQIDVLLKQLTNFEDQAEKSMNETYKDECQELQSQLNTYILNNKELQNTLSQCQSELEASKKNEKHLIQLVKELEEAVDEKNSEIAACHEEIKKLKEENEDLQGEIETLKYDQIDVNKRGNSVFAELDDRRTMVEREYKNLRKKYEMFQKDYEEKKKELDRARGHMAILQSMTSRDHQQAYIDTLEESLFSARQEITDLVHKLSKAVKINEERNTVQKSMSIKQEYDYLSAMLEVSRKREAELQTEVVNLKEKNMYDNDELVKTQQRLYKVKDDLDNAKQEIFKLKQEIKDLQKGILHEIPVEQSNQPRIEVVEGFKPPSKMNETSKLLNKSIFNDTLDLDIIPGEIELFEDGFQQVKPPRKSNKFILQEFNRVEPEVTNEKSLKNCEKKEEKIDQSSNTDTENRKSLRSSHSKSSKKRNDNCAQQ